MTKKGTLVARARKTAEKNLEDFAPIFGVTIQTLSKWEKDPDKWMNAEKLRIYYNNVGEDGKRLLERYTASFFA